MKNLLLYTFVVFFVNTLVAQEMKATVLDNDTKRPLPFVNVIVYKNGQISDGTASNVEGNFTIKTDPKPDSITISFVGYQRLRITDYSKTLVYLKPSTLELAAIEVRPGLNPALRIIRNAVNNRKENDVLKNLSYTHETYNIFNADVDSLDQSKIEELKDSSEIRTALFFQKQQAFLMETYSTVNYKPVNKRKETITATRTSGLKNPLLSTVAAQIQPFSAYQNPINLFGTDYLNPITSSGMGGYYYELRDTLYDQQDSVFVIEFAPKPGANFKGVKGKVFIHSEKWATTNAIFEMESLLNMESDEESDAIVVGGEKKNKESTTILIAYEKLDNGYWFPKEVRTIIPLGKLFGNSKFFIWNTSFYRNIQFDLPNKELKTGGAPIEVVEEATDRDEAFWANLKGESTSARDLETYRFNDSISEEVDLDRRLNTLTSLAKGYVSIKWFDLDLLSIVNFNNFEGFRLGLGGRTNDRMTKWMSVGGYFAYGFGDKRFKYGGDLTFHLKRSHNFNFRTFYKDDVETTGEYDMVNPTGAIEQGTLYRNIYVKRMGYTQNLGFEVESYLFKSFFVRLFNHNKRVWTGFDYIFNDPNGISDGRFFSLFETGVSFNWKIKDEYIQLGTQRVYLKDPKFPVIGATIVKGWDNAWMGEYNYIRSQVRLDQNFKIMRLGNIAIRGEWNQVWGDVPLPLLLHTPGIFDRWGITVPNSFETVRPTEFMNDQLFTGHFNMQFNPFRSKKGKFAPALSLRFSAAWGTLTNNDRHALINVKTMEKGYYETGFVLDDLLKINFLRLGIGYFYRLGDYMFINEWDNMAIKLSMRIKLGQ